MKLLLVEVADTASGADTLGLGLGQLVDVAVHRVENDSDLWSHFDGCARDD